VAAIISPLYIIADEYIIDYTGWMPEVSPVISNGLLPAAIVLASVVGFYWLVRKKYSTTNNEAVQAVFVLLLTAFVILTVTGIWFRGVGMTLGMPW
jgi:hypothetical protein